MFQTRNYRGEHPAVRKRREAEDRRVTIQGEVEKVNQLTNASDWDNRSQAVQQRNQIKHLARVISQEEEQRLVDRQSRLRQLLANDDEQWKQELLATQETTEDRKKRIQDAAMKLKEDREAKRKKYADEQLHRKFRDSNDDLRHIDGKKFVHHCAQEVLKQQKENAERRRESKAAEKTWATVFEENRKQASQRIADEQAARKAVEVETRDVLVAQMEEVAQRKADEQAAERQQRAEFTRQLEEDAKTAKAQADIDHGEMRANMKQVSDWNYNALNRKREGDKSRRAEEKKELDIKIEEFRQETELVNANKDAWRKELQNYRAYLHQQQEYEKKLEAELEKLVNEDVAQAQAKQDAQWQREADARSELHKQVYATRDAQVTEKTTRAGVRQAELAKERELAAAEVARAKQLEEQEARLRADKQAKRKAELSAQMKDIQQRKLLNKQLTQAEHEAERRAQEEFEKLLAAEKAQMELGGYQKRNFNVKMNTLRTQERDLLKYN